MDMKKKLPVLLIISTLIITSCSNTIHTPDFSTYTDNQFIALLVGTWIEEGNGDFKLEFSDEGTAKRYYSKTSTPELATYDVERNNLYLSILPHIGPNYKFKFETNDKLILTVIPTRDYQSERYVMHRIK